MGVVVLLTDEGFTGFHVLPLALLAGGLAAAGAWRVVFGWRWLATRPQQRRLLWVKRLKQRPGGSALGSQSQRMRASSDWPAIAGRHWTGRSWEVVWPYVSGCSRWLLESPTLVDGTIRAKTRSTLRTGWESAWSPGLERWPCYRGCGICVTRRPGARRVRAGSVSESTCARFMRLTMSL